MKTRIISGIVAAALLVVLLIVNSFWSPISVIALALLAALASYEMLANTKAVKNTFAVLGAMTYSLVSVLTHLGLLDIPAVIITVFYVLLIAVLTLKFYGEFKPEELGMCLSMPILISYSFSCLGALLNNFGVGVFYLILLLNFSSIADCGAYFCGVFFGRHKLAPVISPKKTVEGAVGGVLAAMLGTLIISVIFNLIADAKANVLGLVLITPAMVVVGILGDLFTSAIKRTYGIKDYGNLMPGHGGVLDRCDSILFCAPVLLIIVRYMGVLI